MNSLRILVCVAVASVVLATAAWPANPQGMISWGSSCPAQEKNVNFTGPGVYHMWVGIKNLTPADVNFGTDLRIEYGPPVPDAWRFDDTVCQTGSGVTLNNDPNTPSCPSLVGTLPLAITAFTYDPVGQTMEIRLAVVYDDYTPASGVTYTIWNLLFDHSGSIAGTDANDATCDHAEQPLCFAFHDPNDLSLASYLALTGGVHAYLTFANPSDQFASWNMGCQPVPAKTTTWGRIKGTYR